MTMIRNNRFQPFLAVVLVCANVQLLRQLYTSLRAKHTTYSSLFLYSIFNIQFCIKSYFLCGKSNFQFNRIRTALLCVKVWTEIIPSRKYEAAMLSSYFHARSTVALQSKSSETLVLLYLVHAALGFFDKSWDESLSQYVHRLWCALEVRDRETDGWKLHYSR